MFKKIINFIKKYWLSIIILLIFIINQWVMHKVHSKDEKEILEIYEINIDWVNIIITIIIGIIVILSILLLVAYAILLERKVLASIQKRRGPNLVGIFGLLQPIADALKLIVKETIIPVSSNRIIFIIAPLLTLILSLLNWSIIPFSTNAALADIRYSILMFFAISSLTVYGIIMSGWSSNSKYAFLGALRAAAQVIAYEVSIGLTLIYILLQTSDLNYFRIILNQNEIWNIIPCFIFFLLFFISTLAETNRPPFDLPEAEAELVSGYNVEYSAMSFGFFFLGEYVSIWTVCCLNVILFWGGYLTVFTYKSIYIFSLKVILFVIIFIWVRGSLPRYRYDQLMRLGWKILLPISLGFVILYAGVYYDYFYDSITKFYYYTELGLKLYEKTMEFYEHWADVDYDYFYDLKRKYSYYTGFDIKLDEKITESKWFGINNVYPESIYKKSRVLIEYSIEHLNALNKGFGLYLELKNNIFYRNRKLFPNILECYRWLELMEMRKHFNMNFLLRQRELGIYSYMKSLNKEHLEFFSKNLSKAKEDLINLLYSRTDKKISDAEIVKILQELDQLYTFKEFNEEDLAEAEKQIKDRKISDAEIVKILQELDQFEKGILEIIEMKKEKEFLEEINEKLKK